MQEQTEAGSFALGLRQQGFLIFEARPFIFLIQEKSTGSILFTSWPGRRADEGKPVIPAFPILNKGFTQFISRGILSWMLPHIKTLTGLNVR